MNIFETIRQETLNHRQRTALIDGEDSVSYGELLAAAEQVSVALGDRGVEPFKRVGLLCDDSLDYVIVSLAILSLSAVVVPVSPEQTREEIDAVIERIDLDFLIAEPRLRSGDGFEAFCSSGLRAKQFVIVGRSVREQPPAEYFKVNPAFIRFSSGTTGTSKGVVLSHEAILARTDAADKGLQITPEDTVLWVLSMSHHFVVTILLFLRRGAAIVLCGRQLPETLIDGITNHQGTFIYASPFHYGLLARSGDLPGNALKNVRLAVSTAMKLPELVAAEFYEKFGFELAEAYGIIEVGLPFVRLSGGSDKRGSVGKVLPDFTIRLDHQDADGVGEIRVKGSGLLDAYYSPWQSRDEILSDGWFATGDLGKLDQDGFLSIVGREKDVINFVGMKVFAQEVEAVLNQHPQVAESLVYGVPHPRFGELPTAKIVVRGGADENTLTGELRRFCYQRLAQYKVPKEYEIVENLPKTASGKLMRRQG